MTTVSLPEGRNAFKVREWCKRCGCEPYKDVRTYKGWRELGYNVARGAKAMKLWRCWVFCRCQVEARSPQARMQERERLDLLQEYAEAKEELSGLREAKVFVPAFGTQERYEYDSERRVRSERTGGRVPTKAAQVKATEERVRALEMAL